MAVKVTPVESPLPMTRLHPLLFVPREYGTREQLTQHQSQDQQHQHPQDAVDYAEMHQREDVERFRTPLVGLEERRVKLWPVDLGDPVVAQAEPDEEEHVEGDGGDPGAGRGSQETVFEVRDGHGQVEALVAAGLDLRVEEPQHAYDGDAAPDEHVDG